MKKAYVKRGKLYYMFFRSLRRHDVKMALKLARRIAAWGEEAV